MTFSPPAPINIDQQDLRPLVTDITAFQDAVRDCRQSHTSEGSPSAGTMSSQAWERMKASALAIEKKLAGLGTVPTRRPAGAFCIVHGKGGQEVTQLIFWLVQWRSENRPNDKRLAEKLPGWGEQLTGAWTVGLTAPEFSDLRDLPEKIDRLLHRFSIAGVRCDPTSARQSATLPATSTNQLEHDGAVWRVTFEGVSFTVSHRKGWDILARILQHPHRSIHAMQLEGISIDKLPASQTDAEVLDAKAKEDLGRRLKENMENLPELRQSAEAGNSIANQNVNKLETENESIRDQLQKYVRPGGKSRKQSQGNEARRSADRIKSNLADVRKQLTPSANTAAFPRLTIEKMALLAEHLKDHVNQTGVDYVYRPVSGFPVWTVTT